ncbi:MAG: HEAT repeat domain-containing protein [Candidatus Fermentibacteraceae bacterium]|nr:HEAT repeat domain-containing protein [Candidatus Fermentibacteraceae bacterium]
MLTVFVHFLLISLVPSPAMDAAAAALDSAGMTVEGMNFDRNWASGVKLADSTVVRCIQDVWVLPDVADSVYTSAVDLSGIEPIDGGVDSLIAVLQQTKLSFDMVLDTLSCADSLALLCGGMWAHDDSVGTPGEWGLLFTSRGLCVPMEEDSLDLDLDEFTELLTRWPDVCNPSPELIIGLVKGLELRQIPGCENAPGVEGTVIDYSIDSGFTWVIGGTGRNVYTDGAVYDLIVDVGGDDLYLTGADATGILGNSVALIADISGNDTYISHVPVSQGSGFMGYGALVDICGDDVYRGSSMSQGSAVMGGALFADLEGNDYFTADVHSQGAATMGHALLLDGGGDDYRKVSAYGQGFGGPGGTASLVDCMGNDSYLAGFTYPHEPLLPQDNIAMSQGFGLGLRPFCAGGIGTLCDLGEGNDTYRAEVFGQGCAYYYSLGVLVDEGGQDIYSSAQYSQGSGIHLASGILVDMEGDDQYVSRNGPSQGSAHDLSTGFLLDMEGDDYYATDGGQGLALTNSAAVFMDISGSDVYAVRNMGQGQANWARGSSGSGLFIDLADNDFYMGEGADSTHWEREYSAGLDLPGVTEVPEDEIQETGNPAELDMDSLFTVASEWGVSGNRARVLAHREELASRGRETVDYILQEHLDSWDGLEHRAVKTVFLENKDYAVEQLLAVLDTDLEKRELGNVIQWLGETAGEEARSQLEEMLSDSLSTGILTTLIRTLGDIGNSESLQLIVPFSCSEVERVRRQTAVSLGEFGELSEEILRSMLTDSSLAVRSAAWKALDGIISQDEE